MIHMQRKWCSRLPRVAFRIIIPSEARNLGFAYTVTAA
jgi:hypothetical protein